MALIQYNSGLTFKKKKKKAFGLGFLPPPEHLSAPTLLGSLMAGEATWEGGSGSLAGDRERGHPLLATA